MGKFFTNWKTSLFGVGAGALNMLANGASWKTVLVSVFMAAFGLVAKDYDKSNAPAPLAVAASTTEATRLK